MRLPNPSACVSMTRMPQESLLGSLPSFSKTAFSQTVPQIQYRHVRRIKQRNPKQDGNSAAAAAEECSPIMTKQVTFPNAKNIMLINGVDPDCKHKANYKSTDSPLPFLYSNNSIPIADFVPPKPQPVPLIAVLEPSPSSGQACERKHPKRGSEWRVKAELMAQSERKRPKQEAERRAEALAKQGRC